jgi:hypothetical protein
LQALLTAYRDVLKRYDALYRKMATFVAPGPDFLFNEDIRNQRLFEDNNLTMTRRYFYAHQVLGNVIESINAMRNAFRDTFTEDVWRGRSKTLWPLDGPSGRNDLCLRRLNQLEGQFEQVMRELENHQRECHQLRKDIETLQSTLFSGTLIQQGSNVRILTIVNMSFLVRRAVHCGRHCHVLTAYSPSPS